VEGCAGNAAPEFETIAQADIQAFTRGQACGNCPMGKIVLFEA